MFAPAQWALAIERQVPSAADVADEADWIWNLADDLFPDSVQIVDWFMRRSTWPARPKPSIQPTPTPPTPGSKPDGTACFWARPISRLSRWRGRACPLRRTTFANIPGACTFDQEFHEQDYPIGSGTVESGTPAPRLPALPAGAGVKRFKQRLCGAGMRWPRLALDRMLVLRAAFMAGTFDALWTAARN